MVVLFLHVSSDLKNTCIHPQALVDRGAQIGARSRVWAFAHVLPGAVVGEDCNICDHTFIEGKVRLGNRVTLKCGVYLWDGLVLEDDVFVGPAAVFTNDMRPRSKQYPDAFPTTLLSRGCSIGAGAIILPGVTIGAWSMVGAGSVVTRDVAPHSLVVGSPARFRAWICRCGKELDFGDHGVAGCCNRQYQRKESPERIEETTL
jgi:acetyltransferase-like isoleucine patch superfamily enzyme